MITGVDGDVVDGNALAQQVVLERSDRSGRDITIIQRMEEEQRAVKFGDAILWSSLAQGGRHPGNPFVECFDPIRSEPFLEITNRRVGNAGPDEVGGRSNLQSKGGG